MANANNILKVIDGLSTGRFTQGYRALGQRFTPAGGLCLCALGVACEIARANGVSLNVVDSEKWRYYDSQRTALPDSVRTWLGLNESEVRRIAWANDYMDGGYVAAVKVLEQILQGR